MTGPLEHEDARTLLAAEALDALDGEERAALLQHLAGCAACRQELAALRDGVGALVFAPASMPLASERSDRVRSRLLARAAADARFRTPPRDAEPPRPITSAPSRRSQRPWLLAAAIALVAAGLGAYALREHERATQTQTQLVALAQSSRDLAAGIAERDTQLAALTGPEVHVVELAASSARAPSGRMFWDQASNTWTFVAHRLPQPAQGRTYQLWLITPGKRPLPAGVFAPGPSGNATVRAQFALPRDSLAAIAVSVEPTGGVPSPTGQIILQGKP